MTPSSLSSLRAAYREGASPVEVTERALASIRVQEPDLGALLTVTAEQALERARELAQVKDRAALPLFGIPVVLKDNFCTAGVRTTCGSRILENYTPPYNATTWQRLHDAGAILLGKANMDEFAMGSSTEHSALGVTRNPWDRARVPGGSSGGSAVAVAAGYAPLALGSETGGSVRQPASLCGVVGFKPTWGRLSRYGLVAFASSLDHVSVFSQSCSDARDALAVMEAGRDPHDATNACGAAAPFANPLRVGVLPQEALAGVDEGVAAHLGDVQTRLAADGAHIETVSLPHLEYAVATYYVICTAEASSNLARYDGVRFGLSVREGRDLNGMFRATRGAGFGAEVKRRIMIGTHVLSAGYYDAFYGKAQAARSLIREDFRKAFERVDVILTPTSPFPAFLRGAKQDPLQMYLCDIFTIPANLCGIPAVSVPTGFVDGLPLGSQLIGPAWSDASLLQAGGILERLCPEGLRVPPRASA